MEIISESFNVHGKKWVIVMKEILTRPEQHQWILGTIIFVQLTYRSYVVKENEIYKLAPVKSFSLCTWLSEKLFGI